MNPNPTLTKTQNEVKDHIFTRLDADKASFKQKKKVFLGVIVFLTCGFVFSLIAGYFFSQLYFFLSLGILIAIVTLLWYEVITIDNKLVFWDSYIRQTILSEAVDKLSPYLNYQSTSNLSSRSFLSHEWMTCGEVWEWNSEDTVSGKLQDIQCSITECYLEEEKLRRDNTGKKHSYGHEKFSGLYIDAVYATSFDTTTWVFSRETYDGTIPWKAEEVSIADDAFNKKFIVFSYDKDSARACLSDDVMNTLLAFYKKHNYPLHLHYKDQRAFLAIFQPLLSLENLETNKHNVLEHINTFIEEMLCIVTLLEHFPKG